MRAPLISISFPAWMASLIQLEETMRASSGQSLGRYSRSPESILVLKSCLESVDLGPWFATCPSGLTSLDVGKDSNGDSALVSSCMAKHYNVFCFEALVRFLMPF